MDVENVHVEKADIAHSSGSGYDPAEERKLVRRIDLHLMPILCLLLLCLFVDRYRRPLPYL